MRIRFALTAMVVGCVAVASAAGAADWPNFLGPDRDGFSPTPLDELNTDWKANPPKQLWKTPMTDKGYAGPSAVNGRVYIIDHKGADDIVRCIDLSSGKDLWRFTYPDSRRYNYGFARSTPTVHGDRVYTMSRSGRVHCLTLAGKKVWELNVRQTFGGQPPKWFFAASPLVDGDRLILVAGGKKATVVALDKATGKTVWRGGGSFGASYATPVKATLAGTEQYVAFVSRALIGVDAADGDVLWSVKWTNRHDVNAPVPVVSGDRVFITSGYGSGCALVKVAKQGASFVWKSKAIQSHFSTPLLYKGHLYATSDRHGLSCMEFATGKVQWSTRRFEKGGVLGLDGAAIVMDGRRGTVVMFRLAPDKYTEMTSMAGLGGQSWTAPILVDRKLIVRNKNELACYDLAK
jgi:outer membrane protein assembly factor BamB